MSSGRSGVEGRPVPGHGVVTADGHRLLDQLLLEPLELFGGDAGASSGDDRQPLPPLRVRDVRAADDHHLSRTRVLDADLPLPLGVETLEGEHPLHELLQHRSGVRDGEDGLSPPVVLPLLDRCVGKCQCSHEYSMVLA